MDHECAKLIYLQTVSTRQQSAGTLAPIIKPQSTVIKYDRGPLTTEAAKMAYEMRSEKSRLASFNNFSSWKGSRALGELLALYGFFSSCDSIAPHLVICCFCKNKFSFSSGQGEVTRDSLALTDAECTSLNLVLRKHRIVNATCPRSLELSGDNIKSLKKVSSSSTLQVGYNHRESYCRLANVDDTATEEYCNEESMECLSLLKDGEPDPPYTSDLFSRILPLEGAMQNIRLSNVLEDPHGTFIHLF